MSHITNLDHPLTVSCGCTPLHPEDVQPFDIVTHVQGDADWVFVARLTPSEFARKLAERLPADVR